MIPVRTTALTFLFVATLLFPVAAWSQAAGGPQAPVLSGETIQFKSYSQTDSDFLNGEKTFPVTISGQLFLPSSGTRPFPAVIMLHGSGGIGRHEMIWAKELNDSGLAVFLVNSFTGRSLTSTVKDQDLMGRMVMIMDSYRALERLVQEASIDPKRILLMGFSRSASSVVSTTFTRFREMYAPQGADFAGYIAFYPSCNWHFIGDKEPGARVTQPIGMFHGTADDINPAANCMERVEALQKVGANVRWFPYEGATHAFDFPFGNTEVRAVTSQTTRHCPPIVEEPKGTMINSSTGVVFTFKDPCIETNSTIAYNPAAAQKAVADVREFIAATLAALQPQPQPQAQPQ